jgi:uncharacterized protein
VNLREHYPPPIERARTKILPKLDHHCRRFIELSPFLCLGTRSDSGADVSPRGDAPGFVHVLDEETLAIPDWPGNNRLDSLQNIDAHPEIGLLFLVPGVQESLRVNGTATITFDPSLRERWTVNGNHPRSVLLVRVQEAFVHCGKALIRSRLWHDDYKVERTELACYGQMLKEHIRAEEPAEQIQAAVEDAYKTRLY